MSLKLSKENEIQEELRIIGEEIHRISSMVNQMDMFSQAAPTRFELTDVNGIVEDIIHIVKTPLFTASGTKITFRPEPMLPQIMTSRDALKQILLNLLKNASEAMDHGGTVEVRTAIFSKKSYGSDVPQGDGIEIVVEDTGPGLPEMIMKSLYQPFVTTKKNGHSGLGLSIVHKTVKDLGGSISCASIPSEGTSFSIYLPLEKKDFS
jgi:nitrogen-specific signal transduction histidine kinase